MQPEPQPTALPESKKSPLDAVIDEVKTDAEKKPEAYARETIVPEGGE
jgi:hypothetical protein